MSGGSVDVKDQHSEANAQESGTGKNQEHPPFQANTLREPTEDLFDYLLEAKLDLGGFFLHWWVW